MSPGRRLLGALPTALILLAEGAWIAVVYDLIETAAGEQAVLGALAFAVFAWVGSVAAVTGPRRVRGRWSIVAVALVAFVGLVGLVAVFGWAIALLGLAVFRGISVGHWSRIDAPTGSLLVVGVSAIVGAHPSARHCPSRRGRRSCPPRSGTPSSSSQQAWPASPSSG